MNGRPHPDSCQIHHLHKKAKVDQRQQNFIDKFEAALREIAQVRQDLKQLGRHLEPGQIQPIDFRLNMARNHIEYILRESGLKK